MRSAVPTVLRVEHLRGKRPQPEHVDTYLEDGARVYKPSGEPLAFLLRRAVSAEAAEAAYPWLHSFRNMKKQNRGDYSGVPRSSLNSDGSPTNSPRVPYADAPSSVVVGFFDRSARHPYCRQTYLSVADPAGWGTLTPLIQEVASAFQQALPRRYAAQEAAARATHPAYVIPGTPFTTLTVNNTIASAYHYDKGDYAPGFGAILVLRRGAYSGGELVLPAYRVGADLQDRDLLLFDVHELHGNLPIVGEGPPMLPEQGGYERISVVFYFRANVVECLPPEQELERAKLARGGLDRAEGEVRGMKWRPGGPT